MMRNIYRTLLALTALLSLNGCIVTSAVGLAVDTVATAGKIAVKATGAVADAVIPDGDDED